MNDQDLSQGINDVYLEPKRRLPWYGWAALGLVGVLLLGVAGLAAILGTRHFGGGAPDATAPVSTLVPTFTPRPTATAAPAVASLSVRPWTDDSAPVGLVEVTLSLPGPVQVSHDPPSGYRYWRGDLIQTRQGLAWSPSGSLRTRQGRSEAGGAGEVRWYLLREPGTTFPTTLEVTVDEHREGSGISGASLGTPQTLTLDLQPATPATVSVELEE